MRHSSLIALLPLIVGLLLWEILFRGAYLAPANSASPKDTLVSLYHLTQAGETFVQIGYTLFRLGSGVIIGIAAALPVAIIMSVLPFVRRLLLPSLTVCSNVPVVVWIPFVVMLLGTEEAYKISLVAIASFLITTIGVFDATAKTYFPYVEAGRALHFRGATLVRHVILPAVVPAIIGALRASIAFGWVVVFFVEYASAQEGRQGLGWQIADARNMGRIEEEFAYLIILGVVAFVLDVLVNQIQKRALGWMHVGEQV